MNRKSSLSYENKIPGMSAQQIEEFLERKGQEDLLNLELDRQIKWYRGINQRLSRSIAEIVRRTNEMSTSGSSSFGSRPTQETLTGDQVFKELEKDRAKSLIADIEARQLQLGIRIRNWMKAKEEQIKTRKLIFFPDRMVPQMEKNVERLTAEVREEEYKLLKLEDGK